MSASGSENDAAMESSAQEDSHDDIETTENSDDNRQGRDDQSEVENAEDSPASLQFNEVAIPSSPSSNGSSTYDEALALASAIVRPVVELLQADENNVEPAAWIIRPEFFEEDVGIEHDPLVDNPEDGNINGDVIDFVIDDMSDLSTPESDTDIVESDDSNDDEEDANYDLSLPDAHQYLGDNLIESRGCTMFAEKSTVTLPLFNLLTVIFPGQVLPFDSTNMNLQIFWQLKNCVQMGRLTVGVMSSPNTNKYGTTAEIRKTSIDDDNVKLIMEGRQRFELLSAPFVTLAPEGKILVLPEITLGSPYSKIYPVHKFFQYCDIPDRYIICQKHPAWVYKRYEARSVMKRIREQTKYWRMDVPRDDPNEFSYWVAANLPLSDLGRQKALSLGCTEARLMWLLKLLEECQFFGCAYCQKRICRKSKVFPMSRSGPQCSYVNPSGFIHDTITVKTAPCLITGSNYSENFSWFPGYKWTYASCAICREHIGWRFLHISKDTKPESFFGLSRRNITLLSETGNLIQPEDVR